MEKSAPLERDLAGLGAAPPPVALLPAARPVPSFDAPTEAAADPGPEGP